MPAPNNSSESFYERYRRAKGLVYPAPGSWKKPFVRAQEELLVPKDALRVGEDPETGAPVYFLASDLDTHLHVFGASGRGKSFFLRKLGEQLLIRRKRTGEGLAIIDPHGSLADAALKLCLREGVPAEEILYIDLTNNQVAAFNPLRSDRDHAYGAALFVEAMTKVFGAEQSTQQPLTSDVIANIALVLLANQLSLAEAGFFLEATPENHAVRRQLLENVRDRDTVNFWKKVEGLPPKEQDAYTASAKRRFSYILRSPTVRRMVCHTQPGLDLWAAMNAGAIVIVNLARQGTQITLEQQRLLGTLFVQEVRSVAEMRKPDKSLPFTVLIDEFGDFVTPDAMRIFTGLRKFGLRCVFSHQDLEQLQLEVGDLRLQTAVIGVENKAVFGGGPEQDVLRITRQIYADFLDTEERKLEIYSTGFEPVPTPITLSGTSWSETTGESSDTGIQQVLDPDGEELSTSESSRTGASHARTESGNSHEAWTTFYRKFRELSSVQFRGVDEQAYRHMQRLHRQPTGRCMIVRRGKPPQPCLVPDMSLAEVQDAAREELLARVYAKPLYSPAESVDQAIERRSQALLRGPKPKPFKAAPVFEIPDIWVKREGEP